MTPTLKMSGEDAVALTAAVAVEMAASWRDEETFYIPRTARTFRHHNPGLKREFSQNDRLTLYGGRRAYGSSLARFINPPSTGPTDRAKAALPLRHPAIRLSRTMFPSRVFHAHDRKHVLISGINNAKIGKRVTKGAWSGFPIYTLALEERATCPASCPVIRECYGNALPLAVRFHHGPTLVAHLERELTALNQKIVAPRANQKARGFVVRLHVLGDFPDLNYLWHWADWSDRLPALHVWGYTAHTADSEIGSKIALMNDARPDRWQVRFSVSPEAPHAPMQATAIWSKAAMDHGSDSIICPQELGKTQTCGTCALCWNPSAADKRILFLGHGKSS